MGWIWGKDLGVEGEGKDRGITREISKTGIRCGMDDPGVYS